MASWRCAVLVRWRVAIGQSKEEVSCRYTQRSSEASSASTDGGREGSVKEAHGVAVKTAVEDSGDEGLRCAASSGITSRLGRK